MLRRLRRLWSRLAADPPGERFQRYHRRRHDASGGPVRRGLLLAAGTVLLLAGLVLMPAPGPGLVVVAAGGVLLARESLLAARAIDRVELLVRRIGRRFGVGGARSAR